MFESAVGWATIISAICAIIGLPFLAFRLRKRSTTNIIKGGSRNRQSGGNGKTENRIIGGDDNEQRG